MSTAVIEIRDLTKLYGKTKALNGLNLTVERGEIFGFLGPNGAGKTTTCRILTTLTKPTSGSALVSGFDVVRQAVQAKSGMGVVAQHTNIDGELSVYANLKLHGMLHNMLARQREKRIGELLVFTGLAERQNDPARQLSGGLKRRLMIARALLHDPKVLFLDEPTVGLDAQTRRRIWDLIRRSHQVGVTIMLTTHYIEEAEALCHRVGIIDNGRLIALDSPANLLASTGSHVVEEVEGEGRNWFFDSREKATRHAAEMENSVIIRRANLEDVFIRLTGRKVHP
jgi:ABC-2 type transport system ATP-binding protein